MVVILSQKFGLSLVLDCEAKILVTVSILKVFDFVLENLVLVSVSVSKVWNHLT